MLWDFRIKMKPSLFIIYYDLGLGGIQRKIIDIVNFLAENQPNLRVFILLRRKPTDFDLSDKIKNQQGKIIYYPNWPKVRIPFFFPIFVFYQTWRLKPQVILAFSDMPGFASIWSKLLFFWRKIKVVISEDPNTLPSRQISTYRFAPLRHFLIRIFYPFANTVFTVNRPFLKDLIKTYYLSPKKVSLISNWTFLTERKIFPGKKIYDLVFVGRLRPEKNIGFLLKGVKKLKKFRKDISLCLVGEGEEKKRLQAEAKRRQLKGNVFFVGPTKRVKNYLSQSKIFVLSSENEGLPLTILEAMACGLPVLSSNYPGAKDVIKDGINGFIFKNQAQFIGKVKWLLENPGQRRKIGQQAKAYVRQYHSPENINQYLEPLGFKKTKPLV